MPDADKPEFAKQSFKGFVMRIMMMIDMFKKKSDYQDHITERITK